MVAQADQIKPLAKFNNEHRSIAGFVGIIVLLVFSITCGSSERLTPITNESTPEEEQQPTQTASLVDESQSASSEEKESEAAGTTEPTAVAKVLFSSINVRSGPGMDFEPIGYLYESDLVTILDQDDSSIWFRIDFDGNPDSWVAASVVEIIGLSDSENKYATPLASPEGLVNRTYDIASIDDTSYGSVKRFSFKVTTSSPIANKEIEQICFEVVEDFKREKAFNAVIVFLFEEGSSLDWFYTLGKCEYAPHGEWGDAHTVETGDYRTHDFVYDYGPLIEDS